MKGGMNVLSPYQVASIRIISAGLVLLPFAAKAMRNIAKEKRGVVVLSGLLGSFFPAYLFCIAETKKNKGITALRTMYGTALIAFLLCSNKKVYTKNIKIIPKVKAA